jgi:hypothetical protein
LATGPRLYLVEEVLQTKLRRVLAKGNFTQLLELRAFVAKPISQPFQIFIKSIRRCLKPILEASNDIINDIGQHKNSIKNKKFPEVRRNKKLWNSPTLKIKEILIKLILFKINYINLINFQKSIEGINFKINHGSLIMLVNLVVNPAKERLYSGMSSIIG